MARPRRRTGATPSLRRVQSEAPPSTRASVRKYVSEGAEEATKEWAGRGEGYIAGA